MVCTVALRRCRMGGRFLLQVGTRHGRGTAPHDYPLQRAGGNLCWRVLSTHAPARGLCVKALQPPAGTIPLHSSERGRPGAPVAHSGGGRHPPPSAAPQQGFPGLPPPSERHSGVPRKRKSAPLPRPTRGFLETPQRRGLPTKDYRTQFHDRMGGAHCRRGVGERVEPVLRNNTPARDRGSIVRCRPTGDVETTYPATTYGDLLRGP